MACRAPLVAALCATAAALQPPSPTNRSSSTACASAKRGDGAGASISTPPSLGDASGGAGAASVGATRISTPQPRFRPRPTLQLQHVGTIILVSMLPRLPSTRAHRSATALAHCRRARRPAQQRNRARRPAQADATTSVAVQDTHRSTGAPPARLPEPPSPPPHSISRESTGGAWACLTSQGRSAPTRRSFTRCTPLPMGQKHPDSARERSRAARVEPSGSAPARPIFLLIRACHSGAAPL